MNPLMTRGQGFNPMQMMGEFMKNPVGALRQVGYNVPDGMNDPRQIVNHLVNNGQLGGQKLQQLRQMAQMMNAPVRR